MNSSSLIFNFLAFVIAGAISFIGLLTFINPTLTQSLSVQQGASKTKMTITPNLLVARIIGFVGFLFGIVIIYGILTGSVQ